MALAVPEFDTVNSKVCVLFAGGLTLHDCGETDNVEVESVDADVLSGTDVLSSEAALGEWEERPIPVVGSGSSAVAVLSGTAPSAIAQQAMQNAVRDC